jgi:hypothetical protein
LLPPFRSLTADPRTPYAPRSYPGRVASHHSRKRDWRSRHTATDPNGVKSRDVTIVSDRHIMWRPSRSPRSPRIRSGCLATPADRRSGFPEWSDRRRSPRIRSACLATPADRRSGFPEWRDRRRSPRMRSACLAPPANRQSGFPEWRDRRRSPRPRSACLAPVRIFRSGVIAADHRGNIRASLSTNA